MKESYGSELLMMLMHTPKPSAFGKHRAGQNMIPSDAGRLSWPNSTV
jgi:hypothetical protein